ncbi:MAG: bifunctional serine/threonine-protein kinase/formylglycine-generating enzyme family protein [Planctomycetota bacterium]|nr:bifunctional serine/threonine-protein kinase/formylglycine-generating enzyme family protein [Planctomycetota bacterium]
MTEDAKKPPAFFCPDCNQKHRTAIDALRVKPGAVMHVQCVGCKAPLALRLDEDGALVCIREEKPAAPEAAAPAPTPTAPPKAAPTPTAPKSKRGRDKPPRRERKSKGKGADKGNGKAAKQAGTPPAPAAESSAAPPSSASADSSAGAAVPDEPPAVPLEGEFKVGDLIGRYTVEDVIGKGGTSTVYGAFDPTTNRGVAVKVLAADASEIMRTRFLREIEVQANIRHQNIMPVFDRGELDDGRPFFTMEKLYNPWTLSALLEKRDAGTLARFGPLSTLGEIENLIREVILPIADGIYVANVENGVVHRDLKPDNVLIDSRTLRPYVIDFGICQVLDKGAALASKAVVAPTTADEGIVGTPRYLAPEQVRGNVHARTDVWGLGATIFTAITGEPPIASAQNISRTELARRIEALTQTKKTAVDKGDERKIALCDEQLSRLTDPSLRTLDHLFKDARDGVYSELPQNTPAPLRAVVGKAMAVSTSDRYVNARQLATELQAWLGGTRVRALTEAGGKEAAVESARRAVRTHLVTALWLVGGLCLGLLLAKGTTTAGAAPPSTRVADAEADIQVLSDNLDGLERVAADLTPVERNRLWVALDTTATKISERLTGEPDDARVQAVRDRLGFVRNRFAPGRFRVEAPEGTRLEARDLVTGGKLPVANGENALPPGSYHVFTSTGLRFPVDVPLIVRNAEGANKYAQEAPLEVLRIELTPDRIPAGYVLVLGGRVLARDLPFQQPSAAPTEVGSFLMGEAEITNTHYAQFLASLELEERKARAPEVGFIPDPQQDGAPIVTQGRGQAPVVGLRAQDALAFAAWLSAKTGRTLRLPTEAEWVLAAGAALGYDIANGARGERTEADLASPLRDAGAHEGDISPYGVRGLFGNAREMVTTSMGDQPAGAVLVKGAGVGDDPDQGAIYIHRVLPPDERHRSTGFRLVESLRK